MKKQKRQRLTSVGDSRPKAGNRKKDSMTPGLVVIITKHAAAPSPVTEAGLWNEWNAGKFNRLSLPIGYLMIGYLLERVEIGGRIKLCRLYRNGVLSLGVFSSTPIVAIHPDGLVETFNSVYRIEPYHEP